jgi:hypothetical protein
LDEDGDHERASCESSGLRDRAAPRRSLDVSAFMTHR